MQQVAILGDTLVGGEIFGVQRFAYEMLREIDALNPDMNFGVVVPEYMDIKIKFQNIKIIKYGHIKNKFLWRQICFPYYLRKSKRIGVDMTLGLPFLKCDIVCLHDCIYENFEGNFTTMKEKLRRKSYLIRARHLTKKCKKIITVSQYSKKELMDYYAIQDESIEVIYNAWQHYDRIVEDDNIFEKIRLKKTASYFFCLGSALKHKNLLWIVSAAMQNPQYQFVITGSNRFSDYWKEIGLKEISNIIYTGYISDNEVKALMANCKSFIHPAFCEGFGIPPLEALASGATIVVSNRSCLPEIYGNSARYIDPYDYDIDMDNILMQSVEISEIKKTLDKYSWSESAAKLIQILKNIRNDPK